MKKITIPLLTLLILSACGNESTEEQLQEAEAREFDTYISRNCL